VVNEVEIRAGDFTLWLRCDGIDRLGAGELAFVLQFWSLWGCLPGRDDVVGGAVLVGCEDLTHPDSVCDSIAPPRRGFAGGSGLDGW
jgi:hypothetical protein